MKKKYEVFVDDLPIIILNRVLGITQYHDYIFIYKEFRARDTVILKVRIDQSRVAA